MWLVLCINLNLDFVTNETANKWRQAFVNKLRRPVIKARLDRLFYVLPKRRRQCYGLYRGQLNILE